MGIMKKSIWIVGLALLGLTACLKPYEDTAFIPSTFGEVTVTT